MTCPSLSDISPSYYVEWSFWTLIFICAFITVFLLYTKWKNFPQPIYILRIKQYSVKAQKRILEALVFKLISLFFQFPWFLTRESFQIDIFSSISFITNGLTVIFSLNCIYHVTMSVILGEVSPALSQASMLVVQGEIACIASVFVRTEQNMRRRTQMSST